MFWLGLLLMVSFVPGYTGASVPTQWAVLSILLPLSLWFGRFTIGHKLLLCFGTYAFLTGLWALNVYTWVWGLWLVFIWTLSYHWGTLCFDLRPLWKGMAVGLSASAAVAVAQALDYAPVEAAIPYPSTGLFFNSSLLGVISGLVLVALISRKLWWYTPPVALTLVLSGSRGGFAILAVGLLVRYAGALPTLALGALGACYLTWALDPSDVQRLQIWGVTLSALQPFGFGAGSFLDLSYVRHTNLILIRPEYVHNDILQLVYEYGFAALLLIYLFGSMLRRTSHPDWPTAFAFAFAALFYFPLYTPVTAFMGFVLAGSMLRNWHSLRRDSSDWRPAFLSRLACQQPGTDLNRSQALSMVSRIAPKEGSRMKHLRLAITALALLAFGPATAQQSVVVPATTNQIAIAGTIASITKIVTGVSGKSIYVTAIALAVSATGQVTFSYGTGTDCGTGTGTLTGTMTFINNDAFTIGTGNGAVLVVPQGNDLCITVANAIAPGFLAYSIF